MIIKVNQVDVTLDMLLNYNKHGNKICDGDIALEEYSDGGPLVSYNPIGLPYPFRKAGLDCGRSGDNYFR